MIKKGRGVEGQCVTHTSLTQQRSLVWVYSQAQTQHWISVFSGRRSKTLTYPQRLYSSTVSSVWHQGFTFNTALLTAGTETCHGAEKRLVTTETIMGRLAWVNIEDANVQLYNSSISPASSGSSLIVINKSKQGHRGCFSERGSNTQHGLLKTHTPLVALKTWGSTSIYSCDMSIFIWLT